MTPAGRVRSPLQIYHIVVRDEGYHTASQNLLDSGFVTTVPNRNPPPEVMAHLPDPQAVLQERNEGYKHLDRCTTTFNYPSRYPERKEQVLLIPNSFTHLPPVASKFNIERKQY
jgi:hypothetical protein